LGLLESVFQRVVNKPNVGVDVQAFPGEWLVAMEVFAIVRKLQYRRGIRKHLDLLGNDVLWAF
jgi:hypothetical protein